MRMEITRALGDFLRHLVAQQDLANERTNAFRLRVFDELPLARAVAVMDRRHEREGQRRGIHDVDVTRRVAGVVIGIARDVGVAAESVMNRRKADVFALRTARPRPEEVATMMFSLRFLDSS